MEKILLMGAGALARDIIDLVGPDRFAAAYVDAEYVSADTVDGLHIYTDLQQASRIASHYVLAISSIDHRERARKLAADSGLQPCTPVVSATARIARRVVLPGGCVVGHFSAVGPSARVGQDCLIMHGVVVGHDSVIEDNVVICAGVCLGGYVKLGARSFVGTNSVVSPQVSVGSDSFVAAGAACLRDAPANSRLLGNPAKRFANNKDELA